MGGVYCQLDKDLSQRYIKGLITMISNQNTAIDSHGYQETRKTIDSILVLETDARPLYRYRISYSEFLSLKAYLSENYLSLYNVDKTTKFSNSLDKLFVLYAAEWWRREYNGNWGWADLLGSIGIKHGDINNQDLMKITESGLAKWDRDISRTALDHRSAMGSFLREGGLPINYFNASGGWLDLLYGAMKAKALNGEARLYFYQYINRLPKTSGREDIIDTLVALIDDIHNLVITYQLDSQSNPIEHLDKTTDGNWIDSFPFSLEDESARELLKSLVINSANTVKNKDHKTLLEDDWLSSIQLKRTLDIRLNTASVTLSAKIAAPEFLSLNNNSDKITDEDIGLLFYDQQNDNVIGKWEASFIPTQDRMILRSPRYVSIDRKRWNASITLQMNDSLGKLIKGLTDNQGNPINPYQNSSMNEVDAGAPFLASIQNEVENHIIAEYEGSYNQSVKADHAIVFIPDSWQYNLDSNSELNIIAKISENGMTGLVYKLAGKVAVTDGSQKYVFKTSSQDANYQYEIVGRQLVDFTYPSKVIKGDIAVTAISKEDCQIRSVVPKHRIWIAPIKDDRGSIGTYKTLEQYRATPPGCYRLQVRDESQNILFSANIGLVPHDFRYRLQPLKNDSSDAVGNIMITSSETAKLEAYLPHDLQCQILTLAENKFSLGINRVPSEKITLSLTFIASSKEHAIPQATTRPLRFQCYFPSSQTVIYDQHKGKLSNTLHLNIDDDLNGYRIKVFNSTRAREAKVDFHLNSRSHEILRTTYGVDANKFLELKPVDWLPTIKRLLSLSDKGLDDEVTVILRHDSSEHFKITFGYYHYQLYVKHNVENNKNFLQLCGKDLYSASIPKELDELEKLYTQSDIQAFNFLEPEKVITLSKTNSISFDEVKYLWSTESLEGSSEGTYLIYSVTKSLQESDEQSLDQNIDKLIRSTVYHISHADKDNQQVYPAELSLSLNTISDEHSVSENDTFKTFDQPCNYDLFEVQAEDIDAVEPLIPQDVSSKLAPATIKANLTLAEASKISKGYIRLKAMRNIYRKMAFDPHHPEWSYLKTITTNCIHLPLVTLDNWVAARQVPEFMCAVIVYGRTTSVLGEPIVKKVKDEIGLIWSLLSYADFRKIYEIAKEEFKSQLTLSPINFTESELERDISKKWQELGEELKALSHTFETWLNYADSESGHTKTQVSGAMQYFFGELIKQKQYLNAVWPNNPELINTINNIVQDITKDCLLDLNIPQGYMQPAALLPLAIAWLSSQPSHMNLYLDDQDKDGNDSDVMNNYYEIDMRLRRLKNLRKQMNRQKIAIYEITKFAPSWYQSAFEISFSWFSHCHENHKK